MAESKLRIVVEVVTGRVAGAFQQVTSSVKSFATGLIDGARNAGRGLLDLAKNIFFVREALNTVASAARWVWDTFVTGAEAEIKAEVRLKALTGSAETAARIMKELEEAAVATGNGMDRLRDVSVTLAVAAKDASGNFDLDTFNRLLNLVLRFSALKPDIPMEALAKALADYMETGDLALLARILRVPKETLQQMGIVDQEIKQQAADFTRGVTEIETGVEKKAKDAAAGLAALEDMANRVGATQGLLKDMSEVSGMERFASIMDRIADTAGKPIFAVLNEELSKLADWFEANPDKVEKIADMLGTVFAGQLQKLFDWMATADWDAIARDIGKFFDSLNAGDMRGALKSLEAIGGAFKAIADVVKVINDGIAGWQKAFDAAEAAGERFGLITPVPSGATVAQTTPTEQAAAVLSHGHGKVVVEVQLKNEMLDAQIRSTSGDVVAKALNLLGEVLGGSD
jgi:hypothetical protein